VKNKNSKIMNEKQIEELMKVKIEELEHLLEKRREAVLNDIKVKPGDVIISSKGNFLGIVDIRVTDWETRLSRLLDEDPVRVIISYFCLGNDKLWKDEISMFPKELANLKRIGTFTYNKDTLVLESLNIVNR